MLATFVIGLREGLEAALIVGIIAAFLRNNGKSLVPMWLGVALAVALSIAVGVGLKMVEQALPQRAQEGLETIIGAVAVFFVTGMIVWMSTHARELKKQLEADAAQALGRASSLALAGMAFLAVLKEGFETSVFLLATLSAAQSAAWAAAGAFAGLVIATGIGWGIYTGGVRLNLSRFFRCTAAFLVLVAAGLVVAALRTGHEAGWINAGQQVVFNLDWLIVPGSIQSALITGVLGIPSDPRVIEVLGWLAYLVPVALYLYWPQGRRPGPRGAIWLKVALASIALVAAAGLVMGYPTPQAQIPEQAPLVTATNNGTRAIGTARLVSTGTTTAVHIDRTGAADISVPLPQDQRSRHQRDGVMAATWRVEGRRTPANAPTTLTLQQVVKLAGGRIPIGLDPRQHPGPYHAAWSRHYATRIWRAHGELLDASHHSVTTVTLSGSGLSSPRTLSVGATTELIDTAGSWHASSQYVDHVVAELDDVAAAHVQRQLWAWRLPLLLALTAVILLMRAWRERARLPAAGKNKHAAAHTGRHTDQPETEGVTHAA